MPILDPEYQKSMRSNYLFMDADQQEFEAIVQGTSVSELRAGEILFEQQQPATEFFLLVKGKIQISLLSHEGTEKVVDIIKPGNTFAEVIIFNSMKGYPVNSKALVDATVLRIDAVKYIQVLNSSPHACLKIMGRLSARLHWLMNEMERLSLHNASYRLVSHLLDDLDDDLNVNVKVSLSAPKHIIASRLSMTPETFSRTLKVLSQKGLLTVHENYIVLNNVGELREIISI